tara:strand:+ start:2152 stop:2619 length:468 start_codon:yes stop_codon:yes gene_type:complete
MKKVAIGVVICTFLLQTGCTDPDRGVRHQCGSPCPHKTPEKISRTSLLEVYRASALGRDLPLAAQVAASRALQDLLETGDYDHDSRWQLPHLTEHRHAPKGRFILQTARREKGVPCITFKQEIDYSDKKLKGHGKACQSASGLWRIVEEWPYGTR